MQYERGVAPAEARLAVKLRGRFRQLEAQPHQLLREFQRYRELVKRPCISKELLPERYNVVYRSQHKLFAFISTLLSEGIVALVWLLFKCICLSRDLILQVVVKLAERWSDPTTADQCGQKTEHADNRIQTHFR